MRTRKKAPESGDVLRFSYPRFISSGAAVLITLISLAWLVMLFAVLLGGSPGLGAGFVFITACCLTFVLFGVWLTQSHSAVIELTDSGISQKNGAGVKTVRYSEIISVEHKTGVFKSLVLKTTGGNMVIHKNIMNYQQLWDVLSLRLPVMPLPDGESGLTIRCSFIAAYVSCLAFLLPSLALMGIGWYLYVSGQSGIVSPLIITSVLAPFIAVLFHFMLRHPRYYVFQENEIMEKSWAGERTYPASRITKFSCGQRYAKVNAKIGSYYAHFVELEFSDSQKLSIDQKDTGYPIDLLSEYLKKAYHLENIWENAGGGSPAAH